MISTVRPTWSWVFVALLTVALGACSEPYPDAGKTVAPGTSVRDLAKSLDTSIHFYGRILDQHDQPVVGAEVVVNVESFDPFSEFFVGVKPHHLKTDFNGRFELTGIRGSGVFVDTISAEGYEFKYSENRNRSFAFKVEGGATYPPVFIPEKDNPVIFRLRKKLLERTFLFINRDWGFSINRDGSGEDRAFDLVEQKRTRPPDSPPKKKWSALCDLRYWATFDETLGEWEVVFSTCGSGGGLSVSNEKSFVAPENGYKDEFSFIAKDMDLPKDHFLYVKSRTPSIYSRVEITDIRVTAEHVRIYGNSVTNPYGDRVLDAVDFPPYSGDPEIKRIYALKAQLKSEAQAALAEGRLPPRPKIMALIEAAKRGEE